MCIRCLNTYLDSYQFLDWDVGEVMLLGGMITEGMRRLNVGKEY